MDPRVVVRSSILLAVAGAVGLFFAIGIRRMPPPAQGAAPAVQPAR